MNVTQNKSSRSLLQVEDKENTAKINYRVEEWKKFKMKLFEVYEHKIENAPEIGGCVNNSYLGLDEHFVIYFMEKYRDKQRY